MGRLLARRIEQVEVRAAVYKTRREKEHVLDLEIAELMALLAGIDCDQSTMWAFLNSNEGYKHPAIIRDVLSERTRSPQHTEYVASLFAKMKEDFLSWQAPPPAAA